MRRNKFEKARANQLGWCAWWSRGRAAAGGESAAEALGGGAGAALAPADFFRAQSLVSSEIPVSSFRR